MVNFRVEQPETHRNPEKKTAGLWDKQGQSYLYVKTAHFHVRELYLLNLWTKYCQFLFLDSLIGNKKDYITSGSADDKK